MTANLMNGRSNDNLMETYCKMRTSDETKAAIVEILKARMVKSKSDKVKTEIGIFLNKFNAA